MDRGIQIYIWAPHDAPVYGSSRIEERDSSASGIIHFFIKEVAFGQSKFTLAGT